MPLELSAAEARRLALAAQGFMRPPRGAIRASHIRALAGRLGVVQIDSVNALVRSHYLPFFSRLGDYPRELLDELAWGPRRRALFEYWGTRLRCCPWNSTRRCAGACSGRRRGVASTSSWRASAASSGT